MLDNGWRRLEGTHVNESNPGDEAVGDDFTSYYEKPGTDWEASITYYVVNTTHTLEDQEHKNFGIECMVQIFRRPDGPEGDTIDEEIDYDYGDVLYYPSLESAQKRAKSLADHDEYYIFNV